ncbi:MAG: hypothetical protein Q9159_005724 [Coniocarpon cinnabarinum]
MPTLTDLSTEIRQQIFGYALAHRLQDPPHSPDFKTFFNVDSQESQLAYLAAIALALTCRTFQYEIVYVLDNHLAWLDQKIWLLWKTIGAKRWTPDSGAADQKDAPFNVNVTHLQSMSIYKERDAMLKLFTRIKPNGTPKTRGVCWVPPITTCFKARRQSIQPPTRKPALAGFSELSA